MRILDINNVEIESPDFNLGYLKDDKIFVAHHEAIEAVEEQGHEEIIAEYKNHKGEVCGRDVAWIVDVPAVEAQEAWDEYENVQRYILYTEEELTAIETERAKQEAEANAKSNAELEVENELLKSQISALSDQMRFYEDVINVLLGVG